MRALAKELQIDEETILYVIHDNLRGHNSYMMKRGQFLSKKARDNHQTKAKYLLKKLKHKEKLGILLFSSDKKNCPGPGSELQKDQRLYKIPEEVPTVRHRQFPVSLILAVLDSKDTCLIQAARVNSVIYTEVLNLWITSITGGKL